MTAAALSSPPSHGSLLLALQGPRPERALEQAWVQLERGGDLPLMLAIVSALVRAGLAGIAARLLQAVPADLAAEPQLAALVERIDRLHTGEVARADLDARYRANRDALLAGRPHLQPLAGQLAAWPDNLRVYVSASGNHHVIRSGVAGCIEFVFPPPLADHAARASAAKLPDASLGLAFALVGVPAPPLLHRLLQIVAPGGYEPPIDIIETDCEALAAWLGIVDAAMLRQARLGVFAGSDAIEDYRAFLLAHPCRLHPTHCLTNLRPGRGTPTLRVGTPGSESRATIDRAFHDSLAKAVAGQRTAALQLIEQRNLGRDAAFWRERLRTAQGGPAGKYGKAPPLRIVGFTNRFSTVVQHAMRDLVAAFARRGCAVEIATQPDNFSANVDVTGALGRNDVDLIIAINHLRCEYTEVMPASIPFVGWVQDHIDRLCDRRVGATVGDLDLVITPSPEVMVSLYGYRRDRLLPSSNLTDPHIYSNEPVAPEDLERWRCDVSFVSHGSEAIEQLVDEITRAGTIAFRRYVEHFTAAVADRMSSPESCGWLTPRQLIEMMLEAECASGHPPLSPHARRSHIYPQLARIYDRIFRHQTLEWAANWARARGRTLRIFGRGWERHTTLAAFAAGEIENGYPLRCVHQASRISLQANGYASLHQRLLDGLAAGGFLLARFNPADFVRQPFLEIAEIVRKENITDLHHLLQLATRCAPLRAALTEAERLTSLAIATSDSLPRQAHLRTLRAANALEELLTDDGLFQTLAHAAIIPHRAAGDLPGFAEIAFHDEASLHALLDRFVDDEAQRQAIARPMRAEVLRHDTFDVLAGRILEALAR